MAIHVPTRCGWFYLLSPFPVVCLLLGFLLEKGGPVSNDPGPGIIVFLAVPSSLALTAGGIVTAFHRGRRRESTAGIIGSTVLSAVPLLLFLYALIRSASS